MTTMNTMPEPLLRKTRIAGFLAAGAALASAFAAPAHADVKAGVEAWSAGDFARAVGEWRGPAGEGDPDALFNLAQAYRLGRGVAADVRQAETYYAQAAAKGHINAADNYGLLLFQSGRRGQAMPYVVAAAERGDPRAQYLLGIAHFNGDLADKDWVRAYALLTLANGAGLPQATQALRQMDDFVPLAQRQQAQSLAAAMRHTADAQRTSQLAAADLGAGPVDIAPIPSAAPAAAQTANAVAVLPSARMPQTAQASAVAPSVASAQAAVAEAMRATGTESPAGAGADFARSPAAAAATPAAGRAGAVASPPSAKAAPSAPQPTAVNPPAAKPADTGPWRLQLGAFSVAGNADKAWAQVSGSAALAGKRKITVPAGRLTRLFAGGWPTQASAQAACARLKAAGTTCLVTR